MSEAVQFLLHHGYSVVFLWILFERMGIPMPVIPVLLGAGALAEIGKLNFSLVLVVAMVASMLGDFFWYEMGRLRGHRILSFLCCIALDPESCVRRTKGIFARYGTRSILVARYIPVLSTFGPPLAGIFRMRLPHFLLLDGIGTFSWVVLFAGLGYQFGHEIEHFVSRSAGFSPWMVWIAPMGFTAYILWKYLQRKRFLGHLAIARITPEEVKEKLDAGEDVLILDLRDALEFQARPQTIPGAFPLSIEELESQHHTIPRDREIVLFCD
jgi:membrane protein DedA with SNARE-associated domain